MFVKGSYLLVCIRNDGFPMTQTDDYASKRCTIGEAERFCNFGEWDKADYGNCCMVLIFEFDA